MHSNYRFFIEDEFAAITILTAKADSADTWTGTYFITKYCFSSI
jgi:hypothetical protein